MTKQIPSKLLQGSPNTKPDNQKAARLKSRRHDNSTISLAIGAFAQPL